MKENNRTKVASATKKAFEGTQYGNHAGMDAMQTLEMNSPKINFGRPKGDNNRGSKGNQVKGGYFD